MRTTLSTLTLLAGVLGAAPPAIADETARDTHAKDSSGYTQIIRMADTMGGIGPILAVQAQQMNIEGRRREPEQTLRPNDEPIALASYHASLTQVFDRRLQHTQWSVDTHYPLIAQRQFTEIINGEHGAIIGADNLFQTPQAPMLSNRLAARLKQRLLESPIALIRRAAQNKNAVVFEGIKKLHGQAHIVVALPGTPRPIRLFIDARTHLPSKAQTMEDDSVYGDTLWEVYYTDWENVNGIQVPKHLSHFLNGRAIHEQTRSAIALLPSIDEALFDIPSELSSQLDARLYAWGQRSSQYFGRFLLTGIPFDIDQGTTATVFIKQIAPQLFFAQGVTHHSLIMQMQDYLIVLEPPLYNERSQAVLEVIKKTWPDKPVKYIVATHFHNDHIGGLRAYVEAGATLIVGKALKEHFETMLEANHSVYPDALQRHPRETHIITVSPDKPLVISDGKQTLRLFDLPNSHAQVTLIPYIENAKLAFIADLYSPELFPAPIPSLFSGWAQDLYDGLKDKDLDIQWLAGTHGGIASYAQFVQDVQATR